MAAIDSLLRVMSLRGAEAMIVSTGQVPTLRRGGQAEPMAMPPIDPVMVLAFVDELVPGPGRAALDDKGSAEITHAVGADAYAIAIERTTVGFRLLVRPTRPLLAVAVAPPTSPPRSRPPTPAPHAVGPTVTPIIAPPPPAAPAARTSARSADATPLLAAIEHAAARRASDLLLSSGLPPRARIDGDLIELDDAAPDDAALLALVAHLGGDGAAAELTRDGAVDFGATVGDTRVRGHGFQHERGLAVAIRVLRTDVPSMTSLGLPEDLTSLIGHRSGLVLIAGPTGSGKSTTLVALVAHLNHTRARHVITLEDPIEFLHAPDRCLIHQREIGRHAASFATGLRAALREAPDVIVVGELRDPETIAIAATAAETGHLVLGTVHAAGAGGAIDRLIDAYPPHQQAQARSQLAATLRCVVTQYLLPARSGGRAVAIERVPITTAVAALIRNDDLQMLGTHVQTGRDAGMVPLERSLARLVRAGVVEPALARATAIDLDYLERAIKS
ncbi:MAG: PilT/PilU family type 4a pilus ATPase [Myxococcales bacterium]|nr:PilT/PilU family type 4a pilus ATPase [Myxococcales bacterium]